MMIDKDPIEEAALGLLFAQELPTRPVYTIKQHGRRVAGSEKTAYRRIKSLIPLGLATLDRGRFAVKKEVVEQPLGVVRSLLPSLTALRHARRFGRSYNNADINFVMREMPDTAVVTLDFRAWDLTKFQFANDLYVYVDDPEKEAGLLKEDGFNEGNRGHVVLLPRIGSFENEIERIYLDCIANGGRSTLDAIAIQLLYGDQISVRGRFSVDAIKKVQRDMPMGGQEIAPSNT